MKKIVTALMIVLPLVFLIALFAVTSAASVSADISANALRIANKGENGVFSFDIANYRNPMYESDLQVEVLPYKAKNRAYTLKITDAYTGEDTDIVTLAEDGSFALHDVGVAKLTYTSVDGGYTDSVVFNVGSSGVLSYSPLLTDLQGNAYTLNETTDGNYSAAIPTGTFVLSGNFYPKTAYPSQCRFESENSEAIAINEVSGKLYARFNCDTNVKMHVTDAFGNTVTKTVSLTVRKLGDVTVNGNVVPADSAASQPTIIAPLNSKSFTLYVDCDGVEGNQISLSGVRNASYTVRKLEKAGSSAYAIDVVLTNPVTTPVSGMRCVLKINGKAENARYFKLSFAQNDFSVNSHGNPDGKDDLVLLDGSAVKFTVSVEPESELQYQWRILDENVAKILSQSGEYCHAQAVANGETTLEIEWQRIKDGSVEESGIITRKLLVTDAHSSLIFNESTTAYGLGKLAIANRRFDGMNAINTDYTTTLYDNVIGKDTAQIAVTDFENIELTSSDDSIATAVVTDGKVRFSIKKTGTVTIFAKWKYADRFNVQSAALTFNAVDGIYVSDYAQLVEAGKRNEQIVLENDVYLGENLFDENGKAIYDDVTMGVKLREYTQELPSTSDCRYYENLGGGHPNVRYCYEFTNSVYGNGHFISAEYITNMLDSTGVLRDYAVFRGPLDFVAATMKGTKIASVKGQDNISFLVRKNGIKLDNIVLSGCDDESLYDGEQMELNLLNNVGTTLEIMADASVKDCRIKNGRTCVRIFGREIDKQSAVNVQSERIKVTIDGCRMQTAREFVLKIGTNRYMQGTEGNKDTLSPSFYDENGNEYKGYNSSACDNLANDDFFVNNYVLTDVTLKDSTLSKSGLFTVAMESHFAGIYLDKGADIMTGALDGWKGLAATSYSAILHLKGNVVLEDWKELDKVDSSTLIETNLNSDTQRFAFLSLNIKEMLRAMKDMDENCKNLVKTVNGKDYVHGGIAFYGGGKNYHILDMNGYTFAPMKQYNVNIDILKNSADETLQMQGSALPNAAGAEDFRFVMFDATSEYSPS